MLPTQFNPSLKCVQVQVVLTACYILTCTCCINYYIRAMHLIGDTVYSACVPFIIGDQYMTANVHSLLHLPQVVQNLGPLWAHSCFPYEDANGELLTLFHGSHAVEKQVHVHVILILNSSVYPVYDALVEVLWLLCIVYVIRA